MSKSIPREAAVIGTPVSHSLSPAIFAFLAKALGVMDFHYAAREVKSDELRRFLAAVKSDPAFVGLNVTIPHKVAILSLLDEIAADARAVGAVNVVQIEGGRLVGHNTDVVGVVKTLEENGCAIAGENAWVWGAGGAARAVSYALGKLGARRVHIANRDPVRAESLARDLGELFPRTKFDARPTLATELISIVVNATPLGMKNAESGDPAELFALLPKLDLKPGALAFDLIYNPAETPFLVMASRRGLRTVGGLDMLIYQALATWKIWFGPAPALAETKSALAAHLRAILVTASS